jgi:group II intron reverse transcriptase/maturase
VIYLLGKEENLVECFNGLKKDSSYGVDAVSWKEYERNLKENLSSLITRMKNWQYKPQPVRRTYIEKSNGKLRALGIPTTEDKIIEQGVRQILDAIYEPIFLECSYGFRNGKSCHKALKTLNDMIQFKPVNYIIDADIKGFFDNVDQKWLVKFLEHNISDKELIRLIVRMLKSGVMEDGAYQPSEKGTPQGGIVSPILANIYLHYVLDLWIEKAVKKQSRGYVGMVRYADDFIICVEDEEESQRIVEMLKERFAKFKLELSSEKTKVISFGRKAKRQETFNFLGFTHFNDKTRKGGYKVGRKTDKARYTRAIKSINQWLKTTRNMLKIQELWKLITLKLRGHFQYYGVSGNYRGILRYYKQACVIVKKWLNRRSQKRSFNWVEMNEYFLRYPLPKPKIHHNFYTGLCFDYLK